MTTTPTSNNVVITWVDEARITEDGELNEGEAGNCVDCGVLVGLYTTGDYDEITEFVPYGLTATDTRVCEDCDREQTEQDEELAK